LGFFIQLILANGNCLFIAISDQLIGNENFRYKKYRQRIVDFMRKNPSKFTPFLSDEESPDGSYLDHMAKSSGFRGHIEMIALTALDVQFVNH